MCELADVAAAENDEWFHDSRVFAHEEGELIQAVVVKQGHVARVPPLAQVEIETGITIVEVITAFVRIRVAGKAVESEAAGRAGVEQIQGGGNVCLPLGNRNTGADIENTAGDGVVGLARAAAPEVKAGGVGRVACVRRSDHRCSHVVAKVVHGGAACRLQVLQQSTVTAAIIIKGDRGGLGGQYLKQLGKPQLLAFDPIPIHPAGRGTMLSKFFIVIGYNILKKLSPDVFHKSASRWHGAVFRSGLKENGKALWMGFKNSLQTMKGVKRERVKEYFQANGKLCF